MIDVDVERVKTFLCLLHSHALPIIILFCGARILAFGIYYADQVAFVLRKVSSTLNWIGKYYSPFLSEVSLNEDGRKFFNRRRKSARADLGFCTFDRATVFPWKFISALKIQSKNKNEDEWFKRIILNVNKIVHQTTTNWICQ